MNIFYGQAGGMTAVINASAYGVIKEARRLGVAVYAGKNGLLGALNGQFYDTSKELESEIEKLPFTPGGAFGSCRYQLADPQVDLSEYQRIFGHFSRCQIGYFLYNGGNDSQDVTHKIWLASRLLNYPLICIGIPKTIDNDLVLTDTCPGFGSAAKFVANMVREIDLDLSSMCVSSTKIFILEVMGRHTGWIAAASGLARETSAMGPHLILVPEQPCCLMNIAKEVKQIINQYQRCVIVVSEGIRNENGDYLSVLNQKDQFGHHRLGGVAALLANFLREKTGEKVHWAVAGYLQRAARHLASQTDLNQAIELGEYAVRAALRGENDCMVNLIREQDSPYKYRIGQVPLGKIANFERSLPSNFLIAGELTLEGKRQLAPLIEGEAPTKFEHGMIQIARLKNNLLS